MLTKLIITSGITTITLGEFNVDFIIGIKWLWEELWFPPKNNDGLR